MTDDVPRRLYPQFIHALFTGGTVTLPASKPTGTLSGWEPGGLEAIVEVAKAQMESQLSSLDRTISRAQLLFTTVLALIALLVAAAPRVWDLDLGTVLVWAPRLVVVASAALLVLAMLGAAAVIAVRKEYERMNASVLSRWPAYDAEQYAREYAECVEIGEHTTNAHLTVFGQAVRLTVYGALCLGVVWAVAQIA